MKKILLHICCAPCSIYPLSQLSSKETYIMGYFYRSNIHPYSECIKRENTLKEYAKTVNLKVIYQQGYNIEGFFQNIVFREEKRCQACYFERLRAAALVAKKGKFDFFTTTLLYSKFQNHEMIKTIGSSAGKAVGVKFYYEDFRCGWKKGIEESKKLNMYRQQYCGCIYSEKERFFK